VGFDSVHFNISQIPDVLWSLLAQGCAIALAVILKKQKINKSTAVRYQSTVLLDSQMIYERTSRAVVG